MHVHVYRANGQAKFWLEPDIKIAENHGLRSGEISTAQKRSQVTTLRTNGICNIRCVTKFPNSSLSVKYLETIMRELNT